MKTTKGKKGPLTTLKATNKPTLRITACTRVCIIQIDGPSDKVREKLGSQKHYCADHTNSLGSLVRERSGSLNFMYFITLILVAFVLFNVI